MMADCVSSDSQRPVYPGSCSPHVPQRPLSVSLWYLGTHEAIPELVQAGLAKAEIAQVALL